MQRSLRNLYLGIAATGLLFSSAGTAQVVWPPAMRSPPNVTSGSEQGWLPSDKQIVDMQNTTNGFLAAKDDGRSADAYRHLADINTRHVPFDAFDKEIRAFNSLAGPLKERRVTTVTWTKNPSRAPTAGVYAALDIVAKFKDVDRDCGVLILYQSPLGGAFWVMREENTALANATVRKMEAQQSQAAVDKLWAELSARCPNYPPGLAALPEQTGNVIGYRTVDAALAALHTNPGVDFSVQSGWTIAHDKAASAYWSFVPAGHPAYPAAVKRQVAQTGSGLKLTMSVLCQSTKQACDDLVRQFNQLDAQLASTLHHQQ